MEMSEQPVKVGYSQDFRSRHAGSLKPCPLHFLSRDMPPDITSAHTNHEKQLLSSDNVQEMISVGPE